MTPREQQSRLRRALAQSLEGTIDVSGVPKPLQTADGLAPAVMVVHDGAMERPVLHPDTKQLGKWLSALLHALLR